MTSSDQKSPSSTAVIPRPPPAASTIPDDATKKNPAFHKGGGDGQVFHFKLWGLSYGTDDKGHAASLILSVLILISLMALFALGTIVERSWMSDALKLLGTAFTFIAGVAVGKSIGK